MKIALLAAAAVLAIAPAAAQADDMPKAVVKSGYKVPRLADGRPELEGVWSNATTTRLERAPNLGERLLLTPEEVSSTEKSTADRNARQNANTSKETIDNWKQDGLKPDTTDECRSGARGAGCGYNAGWTDPGDLVMKVNGQGRTSLITFPKNGRMPARVPGAPRSTFIAEGEGGPGTTRAGQNDNPETRSLGERCIMSFGVSSGPVMTSQLYNNTYSIVQGKDTVAIEVEMVHDVRLVRMNAKHRTDGIRTYMGDSIGWWEGDTLVVETTGFHPKQNLRGGDENLKVTERFTRVAADRLHYAFKVEDPTVWTAAWGGEYEFAAAPAIYEYACHEGNYGLEGILAGARHEEEEAKAKTAAR